MYTKLYNKAIKLFTYVSKLQAPPIRRSCASERALVEMGHQLCAGEHGVQDSSVEDLASSKEDILSWVLSWTLLISAENYTSYCEYKIKILSMWYLNYIWSDFGESYVTMDDIHIYFWVVCVLFLTSMLTNLSYLCIIIYLTNKYFTME